MTWVLSVVTIGLVAALARRLAIGRGSLIRLGVLWPSTGGTILSRIAVPRPSLTEGAHLPRRPGESAIARVMLASLPFLAACNAGSERSPIQTLAPGVVKVAVTDTTVTDPLDPGQWMYRYAERLGKELDLRIEWVVVPFDKSWELAGEDVVDVVATNVASFPDRISPGGTFSAPFLYEQRALRIRAADRSQYRTIADLVGKKVGAVTGMAAERDLLQRAPPGVEIVSTTTFSELYELFDLGQLDAVAEAEYFTLDGRVIPSHGPDIALIDHHDLNPGQREESVFVVRDRSTNLLEAVNAFVTQTPFPLHLTR